MNETTFLNDKVRKTTLPMFHNPPPATAGGPKRLFLAQGELANFYDGNEGIRYMALVELRPGGVRGNHFHRIKEEQVYLISGELRLIAQESQADQRVCVEMHPGDLVIIATGVAHAFEPIQSGYAVEFSTARFDPSDSQRFVLV